MCAAESGAVGNSQAMTHAEYLKTRCPDATDDVLAAVLAPLGGAERGSADGNG